MTILPENLLLRSPISVISKRVCEYSTQRGSFKTNGTNNRMSNGIPQSHKIGRWHLASVLVEVIRVLNPSHKPCLIIVSQSIFTRTVAHRHSTSTDWINNSVGCAHDLSQIGELGFSNGEWFSNTMQSLNERVSIQIHLLFILIPMFITRMLNQSCHPRDASVPYSALSSSTWHAVVAYQAQMSSVSPSFLPLGRPYLWNHWTGGKLKWKPLTWQ